MNTNSFIQHLLNNVSLSNERILEFVDSFTKGNTFEVMRLMSYLSGFSDKPEVPETSNYATNATLESYDFFENEVHYKYLETRKFKVSEEFLGLDGKVYDDWYSIPSELRKSSDGSNEITVQYWSKGSCCLESWVK